MMKEPGPSLCQRWTSPDLMRRQVEVVAPADKKAVLHSKKNGDGESASRRLSPGLQRFVFAAKGIVSS